MARYPVTYCSQCGNAFGPGDHGFSHCKNHKGKRSLTSRKPDASAKAKRRISDDA